jgi:hypothetical protein
VVLVFFRCAPTFSSVACFKRNTKIERQVFHLTLILSFGQEIRWDLNQRNIHSDLCSFNKHHADCAYNIPVKWTRFRRMFGMLLCTVSLVALVWGLWPLPAQTRSLTISPAEMLPAELSPGAAGGLSAVAEPRVLILEWPSVIRSGDLASIRLAFSSARQGGSPLQISPIAGEGYSVLAEARLELPAIPHTPIGEVSQGLIPGRPVIFIWDLQPNRPGEANGTVWLHLSFIPVAGGPALRRVLTAQRINIRVIDILGLSGPWVRALGSAGVVVGAVLALDGALIWLWSRLERRLGV